MSEEKRINKEDLLKPENMILMYARGAFPMADEAREINWYFPETRTIIPLENYNYPRSLRKFMETADFEYRYDTQTSEVIKRCAAREETWISDELISAYMGLIMLGHVHSVEVYKNDLLVGGLYGISYMGAFFGESMFSDESQASKSALIKLIERLNEKDFKLLDVQFPTPHLEMFGAKEISLEEFDTLLMNAYMYDAVF
ncbi:leucyl/phenylalanyl-tRNA--protein transferase [Bacteroidota bacterium]